MHARVLGGTESISKCSGIVFNTIALFSDSKQTHRQTDRPTDRQTNTVSREYAVPRHIWGIRRATAYLGNTRARLIWEIRHARRIWGTRRDAAHLGRQTDGWTDRQTQRQLNWTASVCLSTYLPACRSVCLPVCLPICLPDCFLYAFIGVV